MTLKFLWSTSVSSCSWDTATFKEHSCNGFSKQNYGLFKQTIDVDDVPCNDEVKEESDDDCSIGKYLFYVNIRMHRM